MSPAPAIHAQVSVGGIGIASAASTQLGVPPSSGFAQIVARVVLLAVAAIPSGCSSSEGAPGRSSATRAHRHSAGGKSGAASLAGAHRPEPQEEVLSALGPPTDRVVEPGLGKGARGRTTGLLRIEYVDVSSGAQVKEAWLPPLPVSTSEAAGETPDQTANGACLGDDSARYYVNGTEDVPEGWVVWGSSLLCYGGTRSSTRVAGRIPIVRTRSLRLRGPGVRRDLIGLCGIVQRGGTFREFPVVTDREGVLLRDIPWVLDAEVSVYVQVRDSAEDSYERRFRIPRSGEPAESDEAWLADGEASDACQWKEPLGIPAAFVLPFELSGSQEQWVEVQLGGAGQVAGLSVNLGSLARETDRTGSALFVGVPMGTWYVWVNSPGSIFPVAEVNVRRDDGVQVRLTESLPGILRIHIRDEHGQPVSFAQVRMIPGLEGTPANHDRVGWIDEVVDVNGSREWPGLRPGLCLIAIGKERFTQYEWAVVEAGGTTAKDIVVRDAFRRK